MTERLLLWLISVLALALSVDNLATPKVGRYRLYKFPYESTLVLDTATGDYRVEGVARKGPPLGDVVIVSPFRRDYTVQHMGVSKPVYSDGFGPE
jgi:hypothetical protein